MRNNSKNRNEGTDENEEYILFKNHLFIEKIADVVLIIKGSIVFHKRCEEKINIGA